MSSVDKAIALVDKSQKFIPTLVQALSATDKDKQQDLLLSVFKQVDTKQNEVAVFKKAKSYTVIKDGKVISSRNITLLIKRIGRSMVTAIIRVLLVDLNEAFNVGEKKGLTKYQIKEITEDIIDEYGDTFFIDELIYIFKKAKKRKIFGKIDGSDIFKWIEEHDKSRTASLYNTHDSVKFSGTNSTQVSDLAKKFIVPIPPETMSPNKSGAEKFVQRYSVRDQNNAGIDTTKTKVYGYKKDKKKG